MAAYVEQLSDPTFLDCNCYDLSLTDVAIVCEALQTNTTLTSIDFFNSSPGFGADGAAHIAEMLKVNTTLTTLHVGYNDLRAAGAQHLADALMINTTLTTFGITGNRIGLRGFAYLIRALKFNSTLSTLIIGSNHIRFTDEPGMVAIRYIARTTRRNTTLTRLDLSDNPINADGFACLTRALQTNSSITNLRTRSFELYELEERNRSNNYLRTVSLFYLLGQILKL